MLTNKRVPESELAVIKQVSQGKQTVWFDSELLTIEQPIKSCDIHYWQNVDAVVGSAQGRGTTWFIQLNGIQAALRHYRRGGLFGKIITDHYFYSGLNNTRSYQEFCLLQHLRTAGVNVPRPIAARAIKRTFCYQADLLSEKIANAQDLVAILKQRALPASTYQAIGREIRKMHDAGVNHTDLNIHNILLDDKGTVWIIDFDKCFQHVRDGWKTTNLERLLRSFRKEFRKHNIYWKEEDYKKLLVGYESDR